MDHISVASSVFLYVLYLQNNTSCSQIVFSVHIAYFCYLGSMLSNALPPFGLEGFVASSGKEDGDTCTLKQHNSKACAACVCFSNSVGDRGGWRMDATTGRGGRKVLEEVA